MHPVSDQRNFGVHGLKVRYHNGSSVVDGYIVKQKSHIRFKVSSTATVLKTVKVASAGTGLSNGTRTFTVAGGTASTAATFTATVTGGSVVPSSIVITNIGTYTVNPVNLATNAATVDSGSTNATFILTFGNATHTVKLAPTTSLANSPTATTFNPFVPGWFTILVAPVDGGTGATFTGTYGANAATVTAGGTRYRVGDVLTASTGGATFTVATLSSTVTVVSSVTIASAGSGLTNGTRTFTVVGGTGTAAIFTATVAGGIVTAIGSITNVGSYSVNPSSPNTPTVDTGSSNATFNLTFATAGTIATVTATTPGAYTVKPSNPVSFTGGSLGNSANATLTVTYRLLSVAASGGTKYQVGQTLAFTGLTGSTPTAHISAIDITTGRPTAVVVDTAGSNISVFATSITKNSGTVPTEHVKKIYGRNLLTTEGNSYTWDIDNSSTAPQTVTVPIYS